MLYVLLAALAVTASLLGAWGAHRRTAVAAWDRELAVAFAVKERREMPMRPVL